MYVSSLFFFFNDTPTTEIYTLSLHDALPILFAWMRGASGPTVVGYEPATGTLKTYTNTGIDEPRDRKSTRLNSSHGYISYAVFCLKKKKQNRDRQLKRAKHQKHARLQSGITE